MSPLRTLKTVVDLVPRPSGEELWFHADQSLKHVCGAWFGDSARHSHSLVLRRTLIIDSQSMP